MPKVNISLPEDVLKEIDEASDMKRITRSEFIRRASQAYIEILRQEEEERKKAEGIKKAILLQDQVREKAGKWNPVKELRKWRDTRR